ncbi:MAG TPA: chemotaxis protein CheW [Rhodocyclaceae bacterium]|nr:chemotaxis protein CheW [Rhodocyclaceae bacterium]
MTTSPAVRTAPGATAATALASAKALSRGQLYLAFMLGTEIFAIDILRIREIIEYNPPTPVPMMPPSLQGVINVRGAVVPVIDLAVRFGMPPTGVGRRTCIVIVEIEYQGAQHVLGLVVDKVNAVTEIRNEDIDNPPSFGTRINADFISGMARIDNQFVIVLNIARTLTIEEIAAVDQMRQTQDDDQP